MTKSTGILAPGTVVDRYRVESVLGQGGMAVVYQVLHTELESLHALKVLMIAAPSVRERLLQEGRVQAQIRHPNIVSVSDVIDVQGAPGLIMEFVRGPSLEDLLASKPLTLEQADELVQGIVSGVAEAHNRGLIHRDLKPANILLEVFGSALIPKVADFGLAKIVTEDGAGSRTRTGVTMGTPQYMSPEQIRDTKNVGVEGDIFALGAILYEMVCGTAAFKGNNILDVFNAVASGRYTPPRELNPDLPKRMETAILGALELDPADRIPDCATLLATWSGQTNSALKVSGSSLPSDGPWDANTISHAQSLITTAEPASNSNMTWVADPTAEEALPPDTATSSPAVSTSTGGQETENGEDKPKRRGLIPLVLLGGSAAGAVILVGIVLLAVVGGALFGLSQSRAKVAVETQLETVQPTPAPSPQTPAEAPEEPPAPQPIEPDPAPAPTATPKPVEPEPAPEPVEPAPGSEGSEDTKGSGEENPPTEEAPKEAELTDFQRKALIRIERQLNSPKPAIRKGGVQGMRFWVGKDPGRAKIGLPVLARRLEVEEDEQVRTVLQTGISKIESIAARAP